MAALTDATVIVEAGETSGTQAQARAALKQNRKLFILNHCFEQPGVAWPGQLEAQGAVRVRDYKQIAGWLRRRPQPESWWCAA